MGRKLGAPRYVTEEQVKELRKAAKKTKNPLRNELIILMLYRHGLRASELCNIRMDHLKLKEAKLYVERLKGSNDFMHPIEGEELRLIRRYLKEREKYGQSLPWMFVTSTGNQLTRQSLTYLIETTSREAGIKGIHPHSLRHGCGYYLANKGIDIRVIQDYLGHKNIQNTVRYTQLSGKQFIGLWN